MSKQDLIDHLRWSQKASDDLNKARKRAVQTINNSNPHKNVGTASIYRGPTTNVVYPASATSKPDANETVPQNPVLRRSEERREAMHEQRAADLSQRLRDAEAEFARYEALGNSFKANEASRIGGIAAQKNLEAVRAEKKRYDDLEKELQNRRAVFEREKRDEERALVDKARSEVPWKLTPGQDAMHDAALKQLAAAQDEARQYGALRGQRAASVLNTTLIGRGAQAVQVGALAAKTSSIKPLEIVGERWQAKADELNRKAAEARDRGTYGLGSRGEFVYDVAQQAAEFGIDAALAYVSGGIAEALGAAPKTVKAFSTFASNTALGVRSMGAAEAEALAQGATDEEAVQYGVWSAAIEMGTERMFDAFAGVYGSAAADGIVENIISRLDASNTVKTLVRLGISGVGEATEEGVSDLLEPINRWVNIDHEWIAPYRDAAFIPQLGYDMAVGGLLGLFGSAAAVNNHKTLNALADYKSEVRHRMDTENVVILPTGALVLQEDRHGGYQAFAFDSAGNVVAQSEEGLFRDAARDFLFKDTFKKLSTEDAYKMMDADARSHIYQRAQLLTKSGGRTVAIEYAEKLHERMLAAGEKAPLTRAIEYAADIDCIVSGIDVGDGVIAALSQSRAAMDELEARTGVKLDRSSPTDAVAELAESRVRLAEALRAEKKAEDEANARREKARANGVRTIRKKRLAVKGNETAPVDAGQKSDTTTIRIGDTEMDKRTFVDAMNPKNDAEREYAEMLFDHFASVKRGAAADEVRIRQSGEREDGSDTGGQVQELEESAGADQSRGESAGSGADEVGAAGEVRSEWQDGRTGDDGERSGSDSERGAGDASAGRPEAAEAENAPDETGEEADADAKAEAEAASEKADGYEVTLPSTQFDSPAADASDDVREAFRVAEDYGLTLVVFSGGNAVVRKGGMTAEVRGMIDSDARRVYVRGDDPQFSPLQIIMHEVTHDVIRGFLNSDKSTTYIDWLRNAAVQQFGKDDVDRVITEYAEAYAGLDDNDVFAEMLCDAYGEMNIFKGTSKADDTQRLLDFLRDEQHKIDSVRPKRRTEAVEAEESTEADTVSQPETEPEAEAPSDGNAEEAVSDGVQVNSLDELDDALDGEDRAVTDGYSFAIERDHGRYVGLVVDRNTGELLRSFRFQRREAVRNALVNYAESNGILEYDDAVEDAAVDGGNEIGLDAYEEDDLPDGDLKFSFAGERARNADEAYLSAVQEGDMETAQKMVDEAAKNAGYTERLYHGTPYGGFTVFKDWQYFSPNREYADRYQYPSASSIRGRYDPATDPKTYGVYVKLENPFDTRTDRDREIFEDKFYRQWGNGAPLGDNGLPDWTDGEDFVEFFEENDYDYDGVYLDEGGDGGYGEEVVDRGYSVMVKDSAQVKSADPVTYNDNGDVIPLSERFDDGKRDIRFSRVTKRPSVYQSAKDIVSSVQSSTDVRDVSRRIREIGALLVYDADKAAVADAKKKADEIAAEIVDDTRVNVNEPNNEIGREIRGYLRSSGLRVSPSIKADFADWGGYYKANLAGLTSQNGTSVDTAYDELRSMFGDGLFPPDVTNPSDRLMHIVDTMQRLSEKTYKHVYSEKDRRAMAADISDRIFYAAESMPENEKKKPGLERLVSSPEFRSFVEKYNAEYGDGAAEAIIDDARAVARAKKRLEALLDRRQYDLDNANELNKAERMETAGEKRKLALKEKQLLRSREQYEAADKERVKLRDELKRTRQLANAIYKAKQHGDDKFRKKLTEATDKLKQTRSIAKEKNTGAAIRAERKKQEPEIVSGQINTIRRTPAEERQIRRGEKLADKVKYAGRYAYKAFVSRTVELERFSRAQAESGMDGATAYDLAKLVVGTRSTIDAIFNTGLVDDKGDVIGAPMREVFMCFDADGKIDMTAQAALQDYMLHMHNIDRMSIDEKWRERKNAMEAKYPFLVDADVKELQLIAANHYGTKNAPDPNAKIVKDYVDLLNEKHDNVPVFAYSGKKDAISAADSRDVVQRYEKNAPWVIDKAQKIYDWWDTFQRAYVVGRSVSEKQYAAMQAKYPHYVPTYRLNQKSGAGVGLAKNGRADASNLYRKATGGTSEIRYIEDSFAALVAKAVKAARINDAYGSIVKSAMDDKGGDLSAFCAYDSGIEQAPESGDHEDSMTENDEREREGANAKKLTDDNGNVLGYSVSFFEDGVRKSAQISEELYHALLAVSGARSDSQLETAADVLTRVGQTLTNPMKAAITGYNPFFGLRNVARDLPSAVIYSSAGMAFPKYWIRAWREIRKSENWNRFVALGGTSATYYHNYRGKNLQGESAEMWAERTGIRRLAHNAKEGLGWFNETSESVTRFAEYLSVIDRLGDTFDARAKAIHAAAEVTVDFSRKGDVGEIANAWIPYWNPAVQGIDKVFRSVFEEYKRGGKAAVGKMLGRAALVTMLPEMLQYVILKATGRDDDWEELSDYQRDNYFCIPLPAEHRFLKIPKNREWGAILGTPLMRLLEWKDGRCDPFTHYFVDSVTPNFLPGGVGEMIIVNQVNAIKTNKNFAGSDIVPSSYKDYTSGEFASPELQWDGSTTVVAKALSELMFDKLSPIQIDYLINDYFGDFVHTLLSVADMDTWNAMMGNPQEGYSFGGDVGDTARGLVSGFVADNRRSNYYIGAYYEMLDALGTAIKDDEMTMGKDESKDGINYQLRQAINSGYGKQISELNKRARGMADGKEKDAVKSQAADLAREAVEFYERAKNGEIPDPKLTVEYSGYSDRVSGALIDLKDYSDYTFEPSTFKTPKEFTDPNRSGYAFTLDDAMKDDLMAVFVDEYERRANALIISAEWSGADDEKRAEMLEDVYYAASATARKTYAAELESRGVESHKKKS